ncbi:hypothetical protein F909_02613 [Acinetobacter sp. ANC 3929]|uniref:hypothetical protein n=1 Tax=unclassified Acinetobacter TaxID=196816 RepID=UPI0002CFC9FB|nr:MULTISPECIES: hypothetical protein [unclassified Acinetobacter]ENW81322.1 hypothetical protein F909_02613 [Acinetobacter sp. ANC 3929]MCH7353832.1 hypothetical protein [Acinetobacter sp. NIPH 2023]MCH7354362.1 hypothetical protein [Acinetobacter sp. NIPH 1958]MCH7361160.1 hypothetical protein [Acinetobacter sp. NIPH 2024]
MNRIVFCLDETAEKLLFDELRTGKYWFMREDEAKRMPFKHSTRYTFDIIALPADIIPKINTLYFMLELLENINVVKYSLRVT